MESMWCAQLMDPVLRIEASMVTSSLGLQFCSVSVTAMITAIDTTVQRRRWWPAEGADPQTPHVGELLTDALTSEAASMIWTFSWLAQSPFECHAYIPMIMPLSEVSLMGFHSGTQHGSMINSVPIRELCNISCQRKAIALNAALNAST